ncbi:plasmid mobilization relaxosome protein MobC [Aliivibrio fischeri]|uniref:plasmid mobilization relaxosome protein MobC n=1 Tax=Aliivibrio fischeri TaxID=668 RepID=UPI0012DA3EAD|nr:plasmid mobilization relaxosome protein MobC [Aliivibrio fischeri]MUK94677.1 plasmid mobilization relaxosome protein MobC [Aliivibrio fischeri]
MNNDNRPEKFTFRLLELHTPFYDYIDEKKGDRSKVIRHFIKQGIEEKNGMTLEEKEELHQNIIAIKKELRGVGVNLNQIARYFNQQTFLLESDLHKNHITLQKAQKEVTILLNKVLLKL